MDRAAERINFLGAPEWPTEICVGKPDGRDVRFGCARAYHETLASNDELRLRLLGRKGKLPPCLCRRESNKRGCSRAAAAAAARRRGSLLVSQREGEDVLPSCVHTRPTRRCRLEYLLSVPELKRVPSSANAGRKNTREGQAGSLPEAALFPPPSSCCVARLAATPVVRSAAPAVVPRAALNPIYLNATYFARPAAM